MTIQGALQTLAGVYMTFHLACAAIGRPDIPLKLIAHIHTNAISGTKTSWGCPSVFHKDACLSYESSRYRNK